MSKVFIGVMFQIFQISGINVYANVISGGVDVDSVMALSAGMLSVPW